MRPNLFFLMCLGVLIGSNPLPYIPRPLSPFTVISTEQKQGRPNANRPGIAAGSIQQGNGPNQPPSLSLFPLPMDSPPSISPYTQTTAAKIIQANSFVYTIHYHNQPPPQFKSKRQIKILQAMPSSFRNFPAEPPPPFFLRQYMEGRSPILCRLAAAGIIQPMPQTKSQSIKYSYKDFAAIHLRAYFLPHPVAGKRNPKEGERRKP